MGVVLFHCRYGIRLISFTFVETPLNTNNKLQLQFLNGKIYLKIQLVNPN